VDPARFPALQALLRGYLHEDHAAEYGSAPGAVEAFTRDALPAERRAAKREWARLSTLTGAWTIAELRSALTRDLGSAWRPATRRDLDRAFARLSPPGR